MTEEVSQAEETQDILQQSLQEDKEVKQEVKPEDKPEEKADDKVDDNPPEEEKKKEEPIPRGVQKRIDRAVRQKYEAENRARLLEERLLNLERQYQQVMPKDVEPKLEDFETLPEYTKAMAKYIAKQELKETLTAQERQQAERQAQSAQQQTDDNWYKKVELATAELQDYNEVLRSSDVEFKYPAVTYAIKASEVGPKIAYHLALNPDYADDLNSMTEVEAVMAIGRLEAKLQAGSKATTRTPPPVKTVGGSAKVGKSPDKMTPQEFAEYRRKIIARR